MNRQSDRRPLPRFTKIEDAVSWFSLSETAWSIREPLRVALACSPDSIGAPLVTSALPFLLLHWTEISCAELRHPCSPLRSLVRGMTVHDVLTRRPYRGV